MAVGDFFTNFSFLIRWIHVIAGITWIGHLYFFNFVNVPLQASLDDPSKKAVNPKLLPRALWWFRWGAMITFLAGLLLFTTTYMYTPGNGFGPNSNFTEALTGDVTGRAMWIMVGMLFGTIMWFNVWFVIWPAQKSLLSGKVQQDQIPNVRKKALLFSRINTYLSGPMLFGMLAPAHYSSFNVVTLVVAILVGVAVAWVAINSSSKVGTSV